jgi:hypothetical protein
VDEDRNGEEIGGEMKIVIADPPESEKIFKVTLKQYADFVRVYINDIGVIEVAQGDKKPRLFTCFGANDVISEAVDYGELKWKK